jgi:CubicO group peptidase (beta-lactamase class C family)
MAVTTLDVVKAEDVGLSSVRLRRIDAAMRRFADEGKFAGVVTLVARRGRVAHFEAAGLIDREAGRPMERDAIFRIASMAKPLTCTAAMMLFEEGRFLLDDPIADFIPEFASAKVFERETAIGLELAELDRPITIRHLLMHTSGIAYDWSAAPPVGRMYNEQKIRRADETLAEKVCRLAALPLSHQPGARWTYGYSHDVLGRVIEVISGQLLDAFLRERLFDPLEMTDTGFHVSKQNLDRLATSYTTLDDGGIQRADRPELDYSKPPICLWGGGGLVSTAGDYAKFCQMLLNEGVSGKMRLVGRKTVELMTTSHTGANGPYPAGFPVSNGYGYGLGFRVLIDVAGSDVGGSIGEYGWSGALSTYFWVDPAEELFGVVMLQLEPVNSFRWGRFVQSLAYQALVD